MAIFRQLMWYFKLERKSYMFGVTALIVVAIINLFPPYAVGVIVDKIQAKTLTISQLVNWALLLLIAGVAMYVLRYVWRVGIFGPSFRLGRLLRERLYEHFTKLSPQFYHGHRTGDLMAHATNDIQAIQMTAGGGILSFVDALVTGSIVIFSMTVFVSWKLTLFALLPMPFLILSSTYYGRLLHKRFHKAQRAFSGLNDKVQENVSGVRVIKAFGQEKAEKESFAALSEDVVEKNIEVAKIDALFQPTIRLIVGFSFFITVAFGAVLVLENQLTLGQLTQFTLYLGQLVWPMMAFGFLFNIVERGRASYDRVNTLLNIKSEVTEHGDAIQDLPRGDIKFDIEKFYYPASDAVVLKDIKVSIGRGQTLGVVGKTGSGKTTFLRLLLREFDVKEGDITIGDISIYDFSLNSLRKAIGYVPQDNFLFSASIKENIAFGDPTASQEEIASVSKLASIHGDILEFEQGYETIVGERGVTLSGGQKQRISIARALLLNPEILILDDSLSAVDAKTEKAIFEALRNNRSKQTTIISAHRLSAVEHADLIIVLEAGAIVERGTHQQLIQLDGWYAKMHRNQQLESLVEKGGLADDN